MSAVDTQYAASDQGGKVFDAADPDRHGKIIKAGPEVSQIRFDDGAERNIPNNHLQMVDAPPVDVGLCQHNPSPVSEKVCLA
jgi:hypothetical protein